MCHLLPCAENDPLPPKQCHQGPLPSQSTRGQSVLVWHKGRTSFSLWWCSQFKQIKECWAQRTSLRREGWKHGRREGRGWERERERPSGRTKWESMEGGRRDKSKRGNGSAESAFYSFQLLENWATELGGTKTQTNCCLENKSSFLSISPRCSVGPCWGSGFKRCTVDGVRFQTLEHDKNSSREEKRKIMKHS